MKEQYINEIFKQELNTLPSEIKRFTVGHGNYVFYVKTQKKEYVIRCSENPYTETIHWLNELHKIDIPVSEILNTGIYKDMYYMICSYIKGKDIGLVYHTLSDNDKKEIAKDVIQIQHKVSQLQISNKCDWNAWVQSSLNRSRERISANGYFDLKKVDYLETLLPQFEDYFKNIIPVAYLDDISTKNLLIYNNRVSGIIDVDWMGYGDPLTFVALTNMALLNMNYDTVYIDYLLEEMKINKMEYKVFLFYSLLCCVDFMGERGTTFNDITIEVNEEIINTLNEIYDDLLIKLIC